MGVPETVAERINRETGFYFELPCSAGKQNGRPKVTPCQGRKEVAHEHLPTGGAPSFCSNCSSGIYCVPRSARIPAFQKPEEKLSHVGDQEHHHLTFTLVLCIGSSPPSLKKLNIERKTRNRTFSQLTVTTLLRSLLSSCLSRALRKPVHPLAPQHTPDEPGQHVPSGPRWTPIGQRARSEGSLLQKPQSHARQRLLLRGDSTKARPQALAHSCSPQVWFVAPCPSTRADGWRTAETKAAVKTASRLPTWLS